MSEWEHKPPECKRCGKPIGFMRNWWGKWVVLEPYPKEWHRETYVEVEREVFISVFRHECKGVTTDS